MLRDTLLGWCAPCCVLALATASLCAQQTPPAPTGAPPDTNTSTPDATAPGSSTLVAGPSQPKPPIEPYILEDGGISIEPIYWFNRSQPNLTGGAAATLYGDLSYPGNANNSVGGEIALPAGRSNTLRISYFRVQGNGNSTADQFVNIFGETYGPGNYLNASYTLQVAKVSWDYLSYTWRKAGGKIRIKTLYELQYVNAGTNVIAPFKTVTTDSSGNTDYNTAHGSSNLIYPTFGMEAEEALGHHFRWEVLSSGFGIPHHGYIWDAEASVAFRVNSFEVLAGEKAFGFRTSPQSAQYFGGTLSGLYVGLRYYWTKSE